MTRSNLCVLIDGNVADCALVAKRNALAERLGLPLLGASEIEPDSLVLAYAETGLELRPGEAATKSGARVDLRKRAIPRSRARAGHATRSQPLVRAMGRRTKRVIDATAGFGDDAIAIASLGHSVVAIERSAVVAALLEDGCERARLDPEIEPIAARLQLRIGDSCELLASLPEPPDAVYIDPMYPPRRSKSALPRLQVQLLRRLVGEADDADALFEAALRSGARRVIVKRPREAPPLVGAPGASFEGKLARYDVYHRV